MKRQLIILLTLLVAGTMSLAVAQTPQGVLDKCLAKFGSGSYNANYSMTGTLGNNSGTIVLSGKKFRVLSPELKCWYDGTTMWTWTKATGEVSISTPTAADLAMTNPYAIAQNYKQAFTVNKGTSAAGVYTIKLTPKKKSNIKEVLLTVNTQTYYITKVQFVQKNNSKTTITVSGYKSGVKTDGTTFRFQKNQVPKGTSMVDLR